MSRKKKYKQTGPHNSSFMRIKTQLRKKKAVYFDLDTWAKDPSHVPRSKFKLNFPYSKRIQPVLDICGKYDIMPSIPGAMINAVKMSRTEAAAEFKQIAFHDFLSGITRREFKSGKVSNSRLHNLLELTGQKGKVKKPKLIPILDYFCSIGFIAEVHRNTIANAIMARGSKKSTTHVYISCDPWDIFRMGVGKKSFGSCMNVTSSRWRYCTRCPCNFEDSSMAVAFVEDESDYKKINGMLSRMVLRVLSTPDGPGVVLDRLYGEKTLRDDIEGATKLAAKDAGIKYLKFKEYLHEAGDMTRVTNPGKSFTGSTCLNSYHGNTPYLDNAPGEYGFKTTKIKGLGSFACASFLVVEGDSNEKT